MIVKHNITIEELFDEGAKLDYALVYRMSEVLLIPCGELERRHLNEECLEARIFSPEKEYHYFDLDGEMKAVLVTEDSTSEWIDRKYQLTDTMGKSIGKNILCVRNYLSFDGDGQAYVKLTRLTGLE